MLFQAKIETPEGEGAKETQLKNALVNFKETTAPLDNALKTVITIDEKFSDIVSKMGQGEGYTAGIKKNLAAGAFEVVGLGGSIESATKLQEAFLDATGKNVLLSSEAYKGLFAIQQTTGVQADVLLNSLENVGMSIKDSSDLMYGVVETSQRLGANAKAVSSLVANNLVLLNRYGFENGVDGLTKMAARASTLRINMETVTNLADGLLDPEKSIEFASTLSRLGAVSSDLLDPLRLMNLAQNDVGELQNQLGDMFKSYVSFDEKTKKFELFPQGRMMLREFSKELNIPIDQIEKFAFGTAKLDRALQEINFGAFGSELNDETREAIANMAQMNKEGKYEIVTKSGDKQNIEEFLNSFKGSGEELQQYVSELQANQGQTPEDKLVDLAQQQLGKTDQMIAVLNQYKLSTGLALSRRENIDNILGEQRDLVKSFYGGRAERYGPEGELDKKGGAYSLIDFQSLMNPIDTGGKLIKIAADEFKDTATDLKKIIKEFKSDYDTKKAGFKKGEDTLKYPGGEVEFLPQDTIISLTQGPEFLDNIQTMASLIESIPQQNNLEEFSIKNSQFNSLNESLRNAVNNKVEPVNFTEKNQTIERLISQNFTEKEVNPNNIEIGNLNQIIPVLQNITKDINGAFNTLKPETISRPKVEERVENKPQIGEQNQTTTQEFKGSISINLIVDVNGDNEKVKEIFNDPLFVQKFKQKLDNIDFGFANVSQTSSLYNTQMIA